MALLTLKHVKAEVGDSITDVEVAIEDDGIQMGAFGKLYWTGSRVDIDAYSPYGLQIDFCSSSGGVSSFFVPVDSLGGPPGMQAFVKWLEKGATLAGSQVRVTINAA
jgi:hypothetical protein